MNVDDNSHDDTHEDANDDKKYDNRNSIMSNSGKVKVSKILLQMNITSTEFFIMQVLIKDLVV